MGKYIGIYFAFGVGSAALVVVQTLILWIFCSIEVCISKVAEYGVHEGLALTGSATRLAENCMSGWLLRSSALQ